MTQQEITANNILLAEFMELKLNGGGMSIFDEPNLSFFRVTEYEKDGLCPYCHNGVSHGRNIKCYVLNPEKLHYGTDWNWLMSVVEKIETLETKDKRTFTIDMHRDSVLIFEYARTTNEIVFTEGEGRLKNLYNACILFVKWYNENK